MICNYITPHVASIHAQRGRPDQDHSHFHQFQQERTRHAQVQRSHHVTTRPSSLLQSVHSCLVPRAVRGRTQGKDWPHQRQDLSARRTYHKSLTADVPVQLGSQTHLPPQPQLSLKILRLPTLITTSHRSHPVEFSTNR